MFKNMKIEINDEQPLDEVVKELERLKYENYGDLSGCDFIFTTQDGAFIGWTNDCEYADDFLFNIITLSNLKSME